MPPPEELAAEIVVLRRATVADAERIAAAVERNLDHLAPWMPWARPDGRSADPAFQRDRLAESEARWDAGTDHQYVILVPGSEEVIGTCGLMARVGPGALEVGYWTDVDHQGRGVATAAAQALTDAGLALDGVDRVEIHCDAANVRSSAIPRKLGYRLDRIEDDGVAAPAESGRGEVWVVP